MVRIRVKERSTDRQTEISNATNNKQLVVKKLQKTTELHTNMIVLIPVLNSGFPNVVTAVQNKIVCAKLP